MAGGGLLLGLGALGAPPLAGRCYEVAAGVEVLFARGGAHAVAVSEGGADAPQGDPGRRRQALLGQDEAGAYLVDLAASPGTWHNGRRLAPYAPSSLRPGDVFVVGDERYAWLGRQGRTACDVAGRGCGTGAPGGIAAPRACWPGRLRPEVFEQACRTAVERARGVPWSLTLVLLDGPGTLPPKVVRRVGAILGDEFARVTRRVPVCGALAGGARGVLLLDVGHEAARDAVRRVRSHLARALRARGVEPPRLGLATLTCVAPAGAPGTVEPGPERAAESVALLIAAAQAEREVAAQRAC